MKKIFTLISVALVAMSVNAQDVYDAIVDGKLAPEFSAVAGEGGGVANNAADGKSVVIINKGKATVTAVGGTTPANDETKGSGAQQITIGAPIEGKENSYELASVAKWNDINWGLKNQGDIDFWYVTGTGNPYVDIFAKQNSKEGELLEDNYSADYIYYEPDGSVGLPITGLYYKFTATAAGAFKVKVWANKGNRQTFVVNEATKKAERLLASGYINGVNGTDGKKKLLTVEQVDSVHHVYIWGNYETEKAKFEAGTSEKTAEELEELRATCEANEAKYQYVIGNGNQNFWGWLTFDVQAGETYWVFQHSSQIGFGGFEFHEGKTADELIEGIEAAYVFATNFSTYEDETTGERMTWFGEKAIGESSFATTDEEGAPFGSYFQNVAGTAPRQNYCLLPEDVLAHSAKTHELTIAFWVNAAGLTPEQYTYVPFFSAYGQAPGIAGAGNSDNWPMFVVQSRGGLQINNAGWCDFGHALNVNGKNTTYNTNDWDIANHNNGGNWLADEKWHYFTLVLTDTNVKMFMDGQVKNEWNIDGVTEGQILSGFFNYGANYKYICLGGNQAWDWADLDSPFKYAKLFIKNGKMTAGEIKSKMDADFPAWAEQGGDPNGVAAIKADASDTNAPIYNLAGQKVGKDFKGLVIQNGKKFVVK